MFRASQLFIRFSFPFPPRVRCLTPHPTFTTPTIPHHVLPCPTARAVPCCPPVITNLVAAKLCIAIAYSHYKMHVKDHVTLMIKNRKESYMLAFDILGTSRGVESGEDKTVSAYAWLRVYTEMHQQQSSAPKDERSKEHFHIASALFSMVDPNFSGHIDRSKFAKLCTLATQKMKRVGREGGRCYSQRKKARAVIDFALVTQIQERDLKVPLVELVFDGLAIWLCVQVALVGTQDPLQYWAVVVGQVLVFLFLVEVSEHTSHMCTV